MAQTIFVVWGEHPTVPGTQMSAHAGVSGAAQRAVNLVQIMLDDSAHIKLNCEKTATPENWKKMLRILQHAHRGECDVQIRTLEIETA